MAQLTLFSRRALPARLGWGRIWPARSGGSARSKGRARLPSRPGQRPRHGQARLPPGRHVDVQVVQRTKEAAERHYLGVRRAGEWPRQRAAQMRTEYLQRAWRFVLVEGVVLLGLTPLALLAPPWLREFLVGGWVASTGWTLWHQVVVESGSSTRDMGASAEQWTNAALGPLRRKGWRVVNHVVLRHWDIDHVAVGPGGLLVIQTKWASDEAALRDLPTWVRQLESDAHDLTLMLRPRLGTCPVHAMVTVWGPAARRDEAFPAEALGGVRVLPGRRLAAVLGSVPDAAIAPEAVDGAWEHLRRHVERRDVGDLRTNGPPPRPISSYALNVWLAALASLLGPEASLWALRRLQLPVALVPVIGQLVLGALALRARSLRAIALAWLTGVLAFCLLLAVAEIYGVVR